MLLRSPLRNAHLLALVFVFGCEAPRPKGTYVPMPPPTQTFRAAMGPEAPLLYLNKCEGGCILNPGPDDSTRNISSIVRWRNSELPEFSHGEDAWDEMVRCVQRLYEPFEIHVTDVDPGMAPHFEAIVAGAPQDIGLSGEIGGIAPGGCGVRPNSITFTFSDVVGMPILDENVSAAENICRVVGQESAHAFGLDHQLTCDDPMTYLGYCGPYAFQRVDAPCGEHTERPCFCGPNFQNSHLHLLNEFGQRRTPLTFGPSLKLHSPRPDDEVEPLFWIVAEAKDDKALDRVEFFIDGQAVLTTTVPAPQSYRAPAELELGPHEISVSAYDDEGNQNTRTIDVLVVEAEERPDIGFRDISTGTMPERYDGGYSFPDAGVEPIPELVSDGGCTCAEKRGDLGLTALLFLLGGLLLLRGPSLKRTGLLFLFLLFGCEETSGLSTVFPKLELDPEAGTALVFDHVVLPNGQAAPIIIKAKDNGQVPLTLTDVRVESDGPSPFRVSSFKKTIGPGETGEIFVRFEPGHPTEFSGTLVIDSNDPDRRTVTFPMSGSASEPCVIGVWPRYHSFKLGDVQEVTISARSTSDCEIVRIFTDRDLFRIIDEPELPLVVPANSELKLRIEHHKLTIRPGRPIRELRVKASNGQELLVTLEGQAPLWDCIDVFPPQLRFPDTGLGFVAQGQAIITNRCAEEGVLRSAKIGRGYYFYKVDTPDDQFPMTIEPFGQISLWVDYSPFSDRGDPGRLSINTNDAFRPRIDIGLAGRALIPELRTLPALDFGEVPVVDNERCQSPNLVLPIFSVGNAELVLESMEVTRENAETFSIGGFRLDGQPAGPLPLIVPPGSLAEVELRFSPERVEQADPTDTPNHRARLVLSHNGIERTSEVELFGTAVEGLTASTRYTQPEGPKVDMLWVIDDSRSMTTEQNALIDALPTLLAEADARSVDFRMAATRSDISTDPIGWLKRCAGHPLIVSQDYPQRAQALECMLRIGLTGEGVQGPLGAALSALLRANDPRANPNPGFGMLRPDAELAITIVTNEEDQSKESIESLISMYSALKGPAFSDRVSIHAIVGPVDEPCDFNRPWVQAGFRYRRMVREMDGTLHNVCEPSWTADMTEIADAAFRPHDRYALPAAAEPSSMSVLVGGQAVIEDQTDGYTYDRDKRAITLNGSALPAPGAEVRIDYDRLCMP